MDVEGVWISFCREQGTSRAGPATPFMGPRAKWKPRAPCSKSVQNVRQQHEALNQGQGAGGGPGITVRAAGLGSCLLGAVRGMNLAWTNCNLQSSLVYLDCTWSVFILWLYYFLFKCKILKYIFWSFVGYWQSYFFEKKKKLYVIKYTNYPTKQKLTPETTPPESLLQTVGEAQSMIQGPSL